MPHSAKRTWLKESQI